MPTEAQAGPERHRERAEMRRAKEFLMAADTRETCQFFLSYTGVKPPLNLVGPIPAEALSNRNTFVLAYFNEAGALTGFDKIVYGEVELAHRYRANVSRSTA